MKKNFLSFSVSQWFSWLKPFRLDLWIAILVTCNVVLFAVWWLDRKSPKGYYHILKDSDEDAFTLLGKKPNIDGLALQIFTTEVFDMGHL